MSMIKVEDLTFAYPGGYDNVFEDVSFQIDTDWKLGFVGRNGRGKTTFLKLLMGEYEYAGHISASVEFDYFPYPVCRPERMTEEILEEACPGAERWRLLRELGLLEVDEGVLWRSFNTLSNGPRCCWRRCFAPRDDSCSLTSRPTIWTAMGGSWWHGIWTERRGLFWCPTTGGFWMGAWTIFCPSIALIFRYGGGIFPPGLRNLRSGRRQRRPRASGCGRMCGG